MIRILRRIYSKQKLIRGVEVDRLIRFAYARWLKLRKKGPVFTIFAEISSKCNLACANCYRTNNDYPAKNVNMSFSTFKAIVDQAPAGVQYLVTQVVGESASNPELKKMLRYGRDSKKFGTIILDSNLLLKDVDFYQSLFDDGLDRLIVSVDSFDQAICDRLRSGTDIDKLRRNLSEISKNYPDQVHVRVTVSQVNLDDLEDTLDQLVRMSIKRVEIGVLIDFHNRGIALEEREEARLVSIIKRFENKIGILLSKEHICTMPYSLISVNARGNIMPCCLVYDDENYSFGNIQSGLENTYYSEKFIKLRSTFYDEMPPFCEGCPNYRKI